MYLSTRGLSAASLLSVQLRVPVTVMTSLALGQPGCGRGTEPAQGALRKAAEGWGVAELT